VRRNKPVPGIGGAAVFAVEPAVLGIYTAMPTGIFIKGNATFNRTTENPLTQEAL